MKRRFKVENRPSQGSYAIWDRAEDGVKVIEVFTWFKNSKKVAHQICKMLNKGLPK